VLTLPAVPCPYFIPVGQLAWPNAPRLPLGDAYTGTCGAPAGSAIEPAIAVLRDFCNLGYARGRCERCPQDDGPDAVRFAVVKDSGGVIRIAWVREKDHHPVDHGPLDYSVADKSFQATAVDESVRRQAQAYLASYLRRKTRA
jgi:hypothetical protein